MSKTPRSLRELEEYLKENWVDSHTHNSAFGPSILELFLNDNPGAIDALVEWGKDKGVIEELGEVEIVLGKPPGECDPEKWIEYVEYCVGEEYNVDVTASIVEDVDNVFEEEDNEIVHSTLSVEKDEKILEWLKGEGWNAFFESIQ